MQRHAGGGHVGAVADADVDVAGHVGPDDERTDRHGAGQAERLQGGYRTQVVVGVERKGARQGHGGAVADPCLCVLLGDRQHVGDGYCDESGDAGVLDDRIRLGIAVGIEVRVPGGHGCVVVDVGARDGPYVDGQAASESGSTRSGGGARGEHRRRQVHKVVADLGVRREHRHVGERSTRKSPRRGVRPHLGRPRLQRERATTELEHRMVADEGLGGAADGCVGIDDRDAERRARGDQDLGGCPRLDVVGEDVDGARSQRGAWSDVRPRVAGELGRRQQHVDRQGERSRESLVDGLGDGDGDGVEVHRARSTADRADLHVGLRNSQRVEPLAEVGLGVGRHDRLGTAAIARCQTDGDRLGSGECFHITVGEQVERRGPNIGAITCERPCCCGNPCRRDQRRDRDGADRNTVDRCRGVDIGGGGHVDRPADDEIGGRVATACATRCSAEERLDRATGNRHGDDDSGADDASDTDRLRVGNGCDHDPVTRSADLEADRTCGDIHPVTDVAANVTVDERCRAGDADRDKSGEASCVGRGCCP